ncbi:MULTISPECIES: GntR family transcriptional regulator [unclassified Roseibium]|uniref:GntR family transcriptional regulator n=1 Tax=unclassified Roseibium TaxID=2629323 RepID=UPI0031804B12
MTTNRSAEKLISSLSKIFEEQGPIDDAKSTPRYIQLANWIRHLISDSYWVGGDALPPERELALTTGLSRITIRKALELLSKEGLLQQRQGSGTYVHSPEMRIEQPLSALSSFSNDMESIGRTPSVKWITRDIRFPSPTESMILGMSPDEKILRLHRLRLAEGQPLAIELAVVPVSIIPELDQIGNSLYDALKAVNCMPEKALQRMRACCVPRFEAEHLNCAEGDPVLYIERVSHLGTGKAVEYTRSYYRGDRYDFLVELNVPNE